MDYFRLEQDHRNPYAIILNKVNRQLAYTDCMAGNYDSLKRMTVVQLRPSKFYNYPDVLDGYIYVVRKSVKEIFKLFLPDADYKIFCTMDRENDVFEYYYALTLPRIDCLSDKSTSNLDHSVVKDVALYADAIAGYDIFRVSGVNCNVVIVSLAAAECLLRRKPNGIKLTRVKLV